MIRFFKRYLRARTIRDKLVLIGLITTGLATMTIGFLLLVGVYFQERERMKDELLIQATIAGKNSTAALSFKDKRGASEVLTALHAAPSIEVASIYDQDGTLFASFAREQQGAPANTPKLPQGYRLGLNEMEVVVPIQFNGKPIGASYLRATFTGFYSYLVRNALIGLVAAFVALALAIMLLLRLQRTVTTPLQALSVLVEHVSRLRDYAVRANVHGQDEVAVLAAGINTMLDQIQEHDQAMALEIGERKLIEEHILRLNESLEERVRERSHQLETERNFVAEVLNTTSALVLVLDPEGHIRSANRAAQLACGLSQDMLMDMPMWDVFSDRQEGLRARAAFESAKIGDGRGNVEGEWVAQGARRSRIAWHFRPVPDSRGNPSASIIATGNDISRQKIVEARLHEARLAAEEGSRSKSEFLANMSHEMRTPLAGVIGMLDIALRDSHLREPTREYVALGLNNAQSLLSIINDLLDLSKIEAGKLGIEKIDFALQDPIQSVANLFAQRALGGEVAFALELDPNLPKYVASDPTRLRQVLVNLIGNAFKFTTSGQITLRVDLLERAAPHSRIAFSVKDTGIGIPPAALARLFQKFEQADTSTTRRYGGTGLGLAISRQLVELMGGTISVESKAGAGSTFRFVLALPDGHAPEAEQQVERHAHTHQLRVLCAEDFPTNQLIIRTLLEEMGHQVDVAENGALAVAACARNHYDMILMDGRMPVMDGITAARLIRSGGPAETPVLDRAITIVALTANAGAEDRARFMAAGMDDFMSKPLDQAALHTLLCKVIERQIKRGVELVPMRRNADPQSLAELDAMFEIEIDFTKLGERKALVAETKAPEPTTLQRRIRTAFSADAAGRMADIEQALAANDQETAGRVIHGIKGSAAYLGEAELGSLCSTLEQAADSGRLDEVRQSLERLRELVRAACLVETVA